MTKLDWPGLMRAGLQGLRLQPRDFWALTPAELQMMLGPDHGIKPMDRDRLGALLDTYPDGLGADTFGRKEDE